MSIHKIPANITIEHAAIIAKELKAEFDKAHGDGAHNTATMDVYIGDFNEKPIMRKDNFNRSAHAFLTPYFLAYALGKNKILLKKLKAAFTTEAEKDWNGRDPNTALDTDKIIEELERSVDQSQYAPNRNNDGDNDNNNSGPERHVA